MGPADKACWGKQYDDSDDECQNCPLNKTCKPETINNFQRNRGMVPTPNQYSLPVIPQQQPNFASRYRTPTLPQPPAFPSQVQPTAYPVRPSFQHAAPPQMGQQVQVPGYQPHAPPGWNTPVAYLPRPNPANPVWWQYQGETTGSRLGKNILLVMLQAAFSELLRFFTNWTWPSRLVTT